MVYFAVITEVPVGFGGNYACSELLINPDADKHTVGANIIVDASIDEDLFVEAIKFRDGGVKTIDLTKKQLLFCNTRVFTLGEILVMNSHDRTIPDGRKPSRWDVKYETFNDIDEAAARAIEVTK